MTQPEMPRGTPLTELQLPDPTPAPVEPVIVSRTRWGPTLLLGVLMLLAGLGAGYAGRPLLDPPPPLVARGTPSAANAGATLLDLITAKVRHTKGDPRAPVTIIEYGDFT